MLAGVHQFSSSRVKQSPRCFVSLDSLTLDVGTETLSSTYQHMARNIQEGLNCTAMEVRYLYVSSKGSSMYTPTHSDRGVNFPGDRLF